MIRSVNICLLIARIQLPTPIVGRLAPTPSGRLHLGNVCAFAAAWLSIRAQNGRLLLRIEDIDTTRSRPGIEDDIRRQLEWLGLDWDKETPRQSQRDYHWAMKRLVYQSYYCDCSRAKVQAVGGIYPGTCRDRQLDRGAVRFRLPPGNVEISDRRWGKRTEDPNRFGDPVLFRRDEIYTYNLAVVADDIRDGVTEVVRGADLLAYSAVQIRLWQALGAQPPTWLHAPLILGQDGRKLAKSHGSLSVEALRAAGWQPAQIWRIVLPWLGIEKTDNLSEAIAQFHPAGGYLGPISIDLDESRVPHPHRPIFWRARGA